MIAQIQYYFHTTNIERTTIINVRISVYKTTIHNSKKHDKILNQTFDNLRGSLKFDYVHGQI